MHYLIAIAEVGKVKPAKRAGVIAKTQTAVLSLHVAFDDTYPNAYNFRQELQKVVRNFPY